MAGASGAAGIDQSDTTGEAGVIEGTGVGRGAGMGTRGSGAGGGTG